MCCRAMAEQSSCWSPTTSAFPTRKTAVVACLKAGINQFLDIYQDETKAALKDGSITEKEIDELVGRKFRIVIKLGLAGSAVDGALLDD